MHYGIKFITFYNFDGDLIFNLVISLKAEGPFSNIYIIKKKCLHCRKSGISYYRIAFWGVYMACALVHNPSK